MRWQAPLGFALTITAAAIFLMSCGGSSQPATVKVSLSDPATCAAPQGPFRHIYVTVTDVKIHQSGNASASDSGWLDLAPDLKDNPVQVDLLGVANQCFLAMLGSEQIEAGHYQQIRIILGDNSVNVNGNKCGSAANCIMLTSDPSNTPQPLQLSSESNTGIKIPSGQIAGGEFTVGSGETKDLNIDFNACASVVVQGNGQYRLKPVLHAGEVSTQAASTAISGTIIDSITQQPVIGGNTVVALEQKDSAGIDRVVMETVATSNGGFAFCPVPQGTYDVVAVAINGSGNTYAATVITGVQPGNSLGTVPLTPAGLPASIAGQITTSTGSAGTAADLVTSALQSIGGSVLATVPWLSSQLPPQRSRPRPAAPARPTPIVSATRSAFRARTRVLGPSIQAVIKVLPHQLPGSVNYTIDANAFAPGSAGQSDCSPSNLQTSLTSNNATLSVTPGTSATAATLDFTGCQ